MRNGEHSAPLKLNAAGLHILDGSIVPTALGVNPSKTIAALAERGVAQLITDLD